MVIGPEIAAVKPVAETALAILSAWQDRQRDRIQKRLINKLSKLEGAVAALPAKDADTLDAIVGKAISVAMGDAREWKMAILAATINDTINDVSRSQLSEAIITTCESIEPRHIIILKIIESHFSMPLDNKRGTDADSIFVPFDKIATEVASRSDFATSLLRPTLQDLASRSLVVSKMTPGSGKRLLVGFSVTEMITKQAYTLSPLGRSLISYLREWSPADSSAVAIEAGELTDE